MSDHTITWTNTGEAFEAEVECHAPAGSWCQVRSCPEGCDEFDIEVGKPGRHSHTFYDSDTDTEVEHCLTQGGVDDCHVVNGVTEDHPMYTHQYEDRRTLGTFPITERWDGDAWSWEYSPPALAAGQELTSNDPEPPVGTVVVTKADGVWWRFDNEPRSWSRMGDSDDTESWVRVAGNYGPVLVLTLTTPEAFG